jgi:hypothetical protein
VQAVAPCATEDRQRGAIRELHRFQRGVDPSPLARKPGLELLVRGEQGAGADRLGQDQRVAGAHAALGQHAGQALVDQAVDGEAQRQFAALAGVAADQGAAGLVEHGDGTGHHLVHGVLDLGFESRRHGGDGGGRLRLGAHGEDVAQRVVGGDAAEQPGIVDEGAEEIHRVHHRLARRHAHHGGVIRRVQADQHVVALDRVDLGQRARQHRGADLGAAAAATHGDGRDGLRLFLGGERHRRGRRRRLGHGLELGELAHEAAIDPVLPAPEQVAARVERAARGHGVAVAGADQGQPAAAAGDS